MTNKRPFLLIIAVSILFAACGGSSNEPPAATATPVVQPDVEYTIISGPERYGAAGEQGDSYRVVVPEDTPDATLEQLVLYEATNANTSGIVELTYFIYIGRNPNDDSNFRAEKIYEWYVNNGQLKDCSDLSC